MRRTCRRGGRQQRRECLLGGRARQFLEKTVPAGFLSGGRRLFGHGSSLVSGVVALFVSAHARGELARRHRRRSHGCRGGRALGGGSERGAVWCDLVLDSLDLKTQARLSMRPNPRSEVITADRAFPH